jgi:hypothetical protein
LLTAIGCASHFPGRFGVVVQANSRSVATGGSAFALGSATFASSMTQSTEPLPTVTHARVMRGARWLALGLLSSLGLSCSDDASGEPTAGAAGQGGTSGATQGGASSAGSGNVAGSMTTAGSPPGGGSSGGAAGSGGAAMGGSGGSGGASGSGGSASGSCAGKPYIICEDFEATAEGEVPAGWTKQGEIGVATDHAKGGSKSLKVGDTEKGARRIARSASELGAEHWGRLFYRVALPVPAVNPGKNNGNTVIHSTLVGLTAARPLGGTAEYRVLDTIMNESKKHNFIYNVQIEGGSEFGHETGYTYDYKDTWTCAEWHVDNTAKSYTLYIDDMDVTGVKVAADKAVNGGANAELPASFTQMNIGWYNYQAGDGGFTVWIDDIAMNKTRIGCAP